MNKRKISEILDEILGRPEHRSIDGLRIHRVEREVAFAASLGRRWRFDWAVPTLMLAVEYEGAAGRSGRHTSVTGFADDCEKYTVAAILGWQVVRLAPKLVEDGRAEILLRGIIASRDSQPWVELQPEHDAEAPGILAGFAALYKRDLAERRKMRKKRKARREEIGR